MQHLKLVSSCLVPLALVASYGLAVAPFLAAPKAIDMGGLRGRLPDDPRDIRPSADVLPETFSETWPAAATQVLSRELLTTGFDRVEVEMQIPSGIFYVYPYQQRGAVQSAGRPWLDTSAFDHTGQKARCERIARIYLKADAGQARGVDMVCHSSIQGQVSLQIQCINYRFEQGMVPDPRWIRCSRAAVLRAA